MCQKSLEISKVDFFFFFFFGRICNKRKIGFLKILTQAPKQRHRKYKATKHAVKVGLKC